MVEKRSQELRIQVKWITPIWLVGFLWSCESAFFVSAVLGPLVLYHLVLKENKNVQDIKYLSAIPLSLIVSVVFISIYYYINLGVLPDYFGFIEGAISNVEGYFSVNFDSQTSIFLFTIIIAWIMNEDSTNHEKYIRYSIVFGLWSVTSYVIGQSAEVHMLILMHIYIFGLFLYLKIIDDNIKVLNWYRLIPILSIVVTIGLGNPRILRHLYNTITNQDYTLKNVSYKEVDDLPKILSIIKPQQTPVAYIDETRYLNYLSKRQYKDVDTKQMILLTNRIWLPLHPATLIEGYTLERKIEYINRWLDRHPTDRGWIVNANENAPGYRKHKNYEIAVKQALSEKFQIKKRVEYGVLKAVLYEREF